MLFNTDTIKFFERDGVSCGSVVFQRSKSYGGKVARELLHHTTFKGLIKTQASKKLSYTLECILFNCWQAMQLEQERGLPIYFTVSLNQTDWKKCPVYKDLSYTAFKEIVALLEEEELITIVKGYRGKDGKTGRRTIIRPTVLMQEQILSALSYEDAVDSMAGKSVIKSRITKEIIGIDTKVESALATVNSVNQQYTWKYKRRREESSTGGSTLVSETLANLDLAYHQVQLDNHGGRIYCNAQNIRKQERATLSINDSCCTEVDLKANHIHLLYSLVNMECPADPYRIGLWSDDKNKKLRPAIKQAALIAINSKDERSAVAALTQWLAENKVLSETTFKQLATDIISFWTKEHLPIKQFFFSDTGVTLQGTEGKVALEVCSRLAEKEIPVLNIHDGFMVRSQDVSTLEAVLVSVMQEIVGYTPFYEVTEPLPNVTKLTLQPGGIELSLNKQNTGKDTSFMKNEIELCEDYALMHIDSPTYGKLEVLLDLEDVERVQEYRWRACKLHTSKDGTDIFYVMTNLPKHEGRQRTLLLHRLLLDAPAGMQVDHFEGNPLDNRKGNLRLVTAQQNQENQTRARGYYWSKRDQAFQAYIQINGRLKNLGYFKTEAEARQAYLEAKAIFHPDSYLGQQEALT